MNNPANTAIQESESFPIREYPDTMIGRRSRWLNLWSFQALSMKRFYTWKRCTTKDLEYYSSLDDETCTPLGQLGAEHTFVN